MNRFSSLAGLAFIKCHRVFNQRNSPLTALCVSLATLVFLLMPVDAKAQVPTFEGETFQNGNLKTSTISCTVDPRGGGRIDFAVNGVATGPYPGTFNETGYITFDPLNAVTGGNILFEVKDALGNTVTDKGAKVPLDGTASCFLDTKTGISSVKVNVSTLDYTVVAGGAGDSGKATLALFASLDKSLGLTTLLFTEIFHSSNFVPSTLGKVTGGGNITQTVGGNGVTFGFNAQNTENGMKGSGTIIDHNAGIRVKILDVISFSIVGTHATFTGTAEVNGVVEQYRIDVDDLGEPGTGLDLFKVVTDSYGSGGTLSGGNIQVHK